MASMSFVCCFVILATAFWKVNSAPHIIGGGLNTGHRRLVKSVISTLMVSNSVNTRQDNAGHEGSTRYARKNINDDVIGNLSASNVDAMSEVPPPPVSRVNQNNPFFRTKRQACATPADCVQNITDLYSLLNDTVFLGRYNLTEARPLNIPDRQPVGCPNGICSWWPKIRKNLRSLCPWNVSQIDLGENAFPRYFREVNCYSTKCMRLLHCTCEHQLETVTYFIRKPFLDRLALMTKKTRNIRVGCYTLKPRVYPTPTLMTTSAKRIKVG